MIPRCAPYLLFFFIIFLVKMVPPAKRKLVYSSDSEDERRSHPLGPRRAMRGRGSGLSPVIVTPTTTTQPTLLSTSALTFMASTGAPAASRGAKTTHGSSVGKYVTVQCKLHVHRLCYTISCTSFCVVKFITY